jgi:hypothetical protein
VSDRPRKPRRSGSRQSGRRQPPPDATGRETALYEALVEDRTPVTVRTADGAAQPGTIVAFDRDHLTLRAPGAAAAEVRIAFASIRSIELEGAGG